MLEKPKIILPIKNTLDNYSKKLFRRDVIAGLTVAAVAIPQAMAYAQIAGVNLTAGLYAAMVSMIVFSLLSATRYVIVGPDAAMAALAGSAVLPLAAGNSDKAIALIAILSILIGLASMLAVFARVGFIAEFLSRPILLGYMAGLAIVIVISQLPKMFGIAPPLEHNAFGTLIYTLTNLSYASIITVFVSIVALLIGVFIAKHFKKIPVSLVLLVGAIIFSWVFDIESAGVAIIGTIPYGLPVPALPEVGLYDVQNLIIPAIAMMLIAYANTIATARTFAEKTSKTVKSDQEFFGLGASNIASGIYGGLPVSASSVRTAVNSQNNAATQFAQLTAALFIGIALLLFSGALYYLPQSVLAVIIILAILSLFNIKELKSIWHAWRSEAILAVITAFGVALIGVYQGLLLALFLAVLNILRKSAFPNDAVLGLAADGSVRDMSRPPKTQEIPGLKIYRFDAPLFFGNSNYFRHRVLQLVDTSDTPVKWFLWDAETITALDSTSGEMLLDVIHELKARNVTFAVARMKGSIRSIVHHTHRLERTLQSTPHFTSMGDAIEAYNKETRDGN
jgi:sulfate permease, SulP family